VTDYKTADVPDAEMAMLTYAVKLTRTPAEMRDEDVEKLRVAGFDDQGIHDICAAASYFNFVNRMADGLGVELENRFSE